MSGHSPAPFEFLEDGRTEEGVNAGRVLTVCDAEHNDIANFFSRDDAGIDTTREQAIANARLFVAAPALVEALEQIAAAHLGDCPASMDELDFARTHNHRIRRIALAALKLAGEP